MSAGPSHMDVAPADALPTAPGVLVVDVGGTNVKVRASDWPEMVKIPSGMHMTPELMVRSVRELLGPRRYDAISIGYPGPVVDGRATQEPVNVAPGWVGFDFEAAFGVPTRMLNDAAMQALGNYAGGRMLFLGFGTGMGSAMVVDGIVLPLELAHLPYRKGRTYEEYVGAAGRKQLGEHRWRHHCRQVATMLRDALQMRDVVLGGGNARHLRRLPSGMRLGLYEAAFLGGLEMWGSASRKASPR